MIVLLRAFVVGLPSTVSRELKATNGIEAMDLPHVVERAPALMSELMNVHVTAAAVGITGSDENKHREISSRGDGRQEEPDRWTSVAVMAVEAPLGAQLS